MCSDSYLPRDTARYNADPEPVSVRKVPLNLPVILFLTGVAVPVNPLFLTPESP